MYFFPAVIARHILKYIYNIWLPQTVHTMDANAIRNSPLLIHTTCMLRITYTLIWIITHFSNISAFIIADHKRTSLRLWEIVNKLYMHTSPKKDRSILIWRSRHNIFLWISVMRSSSFPMYLELAVPELSAEAIPLTDDTLFWQSRNPFQTAS